MEEPSVLDYLKSRLFPGKYPRIEIPAEDEAAYINAAAKNAETEVAALGTTPEGDAALPDTSEKEQPAAATPIRWPWRSLTALVLAIAAQFSLRPTQDRSWITGVFLLVIALAYLAWAYLHHELEPITLLSGDPISQAEPVAGDPLTIYPTPLFVGILLAAAAFFWGFDAQNPQFNLFNVIMILVSLGLVARAFYVSTARRETLSFWQALRDRWRSRTLLDDAGVGFVDETSSRKKWGMALALAAILCVLFFRYYHLEQVPPEMNSDHAEKILDVLRVLSGDTDIFFAANGGREALQFYLVAALHQFFGIPLGFTILKLVTYTVGFLALPFLYLIGAELGSRRVGLLAFLFAGVAYWPNVVSRVGLRLPFYMLFTAATLYFLLRGIRAGRRNDFIWAGIALGLSFYGYSADRILPLAVLLALGLYLLHRQSSGRRQFTFIALLALIAVSFVLFLPLLRYIVSQPDAFLFRTLTRMGSLERPLEQPAWLIFLNNLWRALTMFSWDDGEVWVISIPGYPALGYIAGGLFYLGAGLLLLRYLRQRHWLDLFLLLSIPTLMLPSILSLAFPNENPNLYRTGGAFVPVFLMIAIALDGLITLFTQRVSLRFAWGLALALFALSAAQDYDLVFNKYYEQYRLSAWNTSEMGQTAHSFIDTMGSPDAVWVVGYPYWVDTRLVALQAGYPGRDYQIFTDQLTTTLTLGDSQRAKLFLLNPQDIKALTTLQSLYSQGWFQLHTSQAPGKEFMMFIAPPVDRLPIPTPTPTPAP